MNNLLEDSSAGEMADGVKARFREFVERENTSKVANRMGVNYQVVHGAAFGIYRPSLETIFKAKIAYGTDFDEVYVFTGIRRDIKEGNESDIIAKTEESNSDFSTPVIDKYEKEVQFLKEKLESQEIIIKELRLDKEFLQSLIRKQA